MKILLTTTPAGRAVEAHDRPAYPHPGLGYLAATLKKQGRACRVVDPRLQRFSAAQVSRLARTGAFGVVGITAMTHEIVQAAELAALIKAHTPGVRIVIGGVHATALPAQTLEEFPPFDIAVHGEGELTLDELVGRLKRREPLDDVEGIAFRSAGGIQVTPPRERVEDLDSLPFPDYSDFPRCREYHIVSSRGCPYGCIFCMSPYGRKRVRERSVGHVLEELTRIARRKPKLIKFNDETFAFHRRRAMEMLEAIRRSGLHHIPKVASLRADHVDAELLRAMKEAGFAYIDYGVETGNAAMLLRLKKGVSLEQTERAVRLTKEAGIRAGANYIIGCPGETWESAMQTIDFAVKLNADVNAIGLMVPYPGTEVAAMAARGEGGYRLRSQKWTDYNKQIGDALELVTLPRAQMEKLQLIGYTKIVLANRRFGDFVRFCWEHRRGGLAFLRHHLARHVTFRRETA